MHELDDCPSENEIVGFLDGAVPEPERAWIEAHCASCERCREGLAHALIDSTPVDPAPDPVPAPDAIEPSTISRAPPWPKIEQNAPKAIASGCSVGPR